MFEATRLLYKTSLPEKQCAHGEFLPEAILCYYKTLQSTALEELLVVKIQEEVKLIHVFFFSFELALIITWNRDSNCVD